MDIKEEEKNPRPNGSISVYTMGPVDFLLPIWPRFLFAPRGIWCLIKESRIGSTAGMEPSYEMLLGDSRVAALMAFQGLF